MPSLALHRISSLQLPATAALSFAPGCSLQRKPNSASLRRRARETSRLATPTSAEIIGMSIREPGFRMSLSATESDDSSALAHIMEPIHEGDRDLLLVFCPGALKASKLYFPLMHAIQAQLSLRLWIAVLHNTDQEGLDTSKIDVSLTGVLARLKQRGFRSGSGEIDNVFIAGHSLGAWSARAVAVRRAQGFIQMGSSFDPKADNLAQHPKPVLTLGGARDGQMTPAFIAKYAGEVLATEPDLGPHNTYAVKPVIIIPGMNHAQFCDGSPNWQRGDLPATIDLSDAQQRTAELIAAFLAVQIEGPNGAAGARGLEILTKGVDETHRRYKALWESLANQAGDAAAHQLHVASPSTLSADNVTVVHHDFVDNFVISKPWIDAQKNKVFITTYLKPTDWRGLCNLWVKMKLREAVLRDFYAPGDPAAPLAALGKEINSKTFDVALSLVSDDEREIFLKQGKKLQFVDDWLCPGPATVWIESDLSFTPTPNGGPVQVQTPVLLSPTSMPPRFAGMHYMKVLTLATAIHWILVDSFR